MMTFNYISMNLFTGRYVFFLDFSLDLMQRKDFIDSLIMEEGQPELSSSESAESVELSVSLITFNSTQKELSAADQARYIYPNYANYGLCA